MKHSIPPFLRGAGSLLVLIAAIITFSIARGRDEAQSAGPSRSTPPAASGSRDPLAELASEVRELRVEVDEDDIVEDVLENPWFELIGFAGASLISASFFAEAYIRRERRSPKTVG